MARVRARGEGRPGGEGGGRMSFFLKGGRATMNNEERMAAASFLLPVGMSNRVLTAKSRNALGTGAFALSGRRYPINDAAHARNALARVAQNGTPQEKARVRAAVHRKFPGIGAA